MRRGAGGSLARDWRQFRLLSRDGVRQLIDTALLSRDADPMEFALWMLALIATPPAFFAARQVLTYTALVNAPLELVRQVALGHRLFFVTYGMLAAALLAALTWDSVFPDGRDQEIVGVLPVRPSVFAAARLAAALQLCVIFSAAVSVPAAVLYSAFCAGHPAFGSIIGLLAGHVAAALLGSLLVFVSLLTARGIAAVMLGGRLSTWLGVTLQLTTIVLMFEVFFFLPGVLNAIVRGVTRGDPAAVLFPPVWFAALHAWLAGERSAVIASGALTGIATCGATLVVVVPVYLLPAGWLGRRALERRAAGQTAVIATIGAAVSWAAAATPPVRSVYQFALASLVRSRRHVIVLAGYLGVAIAISVASVLLIEVRGSAKLAAPAAWVLALPLVFMFFAVLGVRASFRVPTEIDANWPLRLAPPSVSACRNAAILVMLTVAVVPITMMAALVIAPRWPLADVATIVTLQLMAGWLLAELALFRWAQVPFACVHAPSPDVLKAWWPAYLLATYLYAFKIADWQFAALTSRPALVAYVAVGATVILTIRVLRWRRRRHQTLEFDAPPTGSVERLNLSDALG